MFFGLFSYYARRKKFFYYFMGYHGKIFLGVSMYTFYGNYFVYLCVYIVTSYYLCVYIVMCDHF